MSNKNSIIEQIKKLNEADLRKILVLLFREMNFLEVNETHGTTEFGKDIVFYEEDTFKRKKWYSCVVKADDINQTSYDTVVRQVNECFRKKHSSINFGKVAIDNVIVITSGSYKANAKEQIAENISDSKDKNIDYWSIVEIAQHLDGTKALEFLKEKNPIAYNIFNENTKKEITSKADLKFLEADFDVKIGSLEEFQIKVRAKSSEHDIEANEYLKSVDIQQKRVSLKFLPTVDEIINSKKPILIHGIATSGKTTILRKIATDFNDKHHTGIVVYFELAKIKIELLKSDLIEILNSKYKQICKETLDIDKFIKNNELLILIDGLDELANDELENKLLNEIKNLDKKIRIVVSSRTNEKTKGPENLFADFDVYELLPLSFDEMIQLGSKLLEDDKKSGFIRLIKKSEIVNTFPKTPLTTILLALLFKEEKINVRELPKNITELYNKFIDVFLNKWDNTKGISQQHKFQEKLFIFQKIAKFLHDNYTSIISEDALENFVSLFLKEHPIENTTNAKQLLKSLCERSNILVKDENDKSYRFFHLTIQEYLTSNIITQEEEDILVKNFVDKWWLNTNIFYAGKTPQKAFVLNKIVKDKKLILNNAESRFDFILSASKVLQASHLLEKSNKIEILKNLLIHFDYCSKEILKELITENDTRLRRRTILDIILWQRKVFLEVFDSSTFTKSLEEIQDELLKKNDVPFSDITEYSLAYCLSMNTKNVNYLEKFLILRKNLNPRWYKIVDVDINIKHLQASDKKKLTKFKSKASRHREYIQHQFKEPLIKHYNSITSL